MLFVKSKVYSRVVRKDVVYNRAKWPAKDKLLKAFIELASCELGIINPFLNNKDCIKVINELSPEEIKRCNKNYRKIWHDSLHVGTKDPFAISMQRKIVDERFVFFIAESDFRRCLTFNKKNLKKSLRVYLRARKRIVQSYVFNYIHEKYFEEL